jgi:cardiolipin synthase
VVSRDLFIVGGLMLAWVLGNPMTVRPLTVSKYNTAAQILLAGAVLAALGFQFDAQWAIVSLMGLVTALTLLSIGFYLRDWVRHLGIDR